MPGRPCHVANRMSEVLPGRRECPRAAGFADRSTCRAGPATSRTGCPRFSLADASAHGGRIRRPLNLPGRCGPMACRCDGVLVGWPAAQGSRHRVGALPRVAFMVGVGREEFEELVADALDGLPPELARLMDNVAIFVEDESEDE